MTRKRWIWISAVAALALAASAYLIATLTYRLDQGNTWSVGQGAVIENDDVAVHEWQAGKTLEIAVTARNPGRLSVSFDSVSFETSDIAVLGVKMIEDGSPCCTSSQAAPFHPVSIAPEGQVMLWIALRLTGTNPYPPCSGFTLAHFSVRYSVLGMPQHDTVPLYMRIMFRAPC